MKQFVYLFFTAIFALLLSTGCKEAYSPPATAQPGGYLVVEGFINNGSEPTSISLTRSTGLNDSAGIVYENNASVNVEGENGETYPLYQSGAGTYSTSLPALNSTEKYRLNIQTTDGRQYVSDFTSANSTPPIDSISWQSKNDGLQVFVNAHGEQAASQYYQWSYTETWEFHSPYKSTLVYIYDSVTNFPIGVDYGSLDTTIYKCWQTNNSTNILIGTSQQLTENRIHLPIAYIEPGSQKLSVLYSIYVQQHAISKSNYTFLEEMKKNTEQLGSIFDAQPSELTGNIHCVSNAAEIVVGYVEVSQSETFRTFISNKDIAEWNYDSGCTQVVIDNNRQSIGEKGVGLVPTSVVESQGNSIKSFYAAEPTCVDCTLTGTNVKPDFWP